MIEPIPKLKLKNACPIALKNVVASTSEKSELLDELIRLKLGYSSQEEVVFSIK